MSVHYTLVNINYVLGNNYGKNYDKCSTGSWLQAYDVCNQSELIFYLLHD